MSRSPSYCLSGLLLATLIAAGCAQSPTAPTATTGASTAPGATAARPPGSSLTPGFYQMLFLHNGVEVTTLPVGPGSNMLVKVHVEDSAHEFATDGSVLFEICRWKGESPTTGTLHGAAPSARCADGSARWVRHTDIGIGPKSGGNAWAGIDSVKVACIMGWRATYKGSQTIAPAVLAPRGTPCTAARAAASRGSSRPAAMVCSTASPRVRHGESSHPASAARFRRDDAAGCLVGAAAVDAGRPRRGSDDVDVVIRRCRTVVPT